MRKTMIIVCLMLAGCINKQNQELDGKPLCTLDGKAYVVAPVAIDSVFLRRAEFADKLCQKGATDGR